jgi:Phage integrase family
VPSHRDEKHAASDYVFHRDDGRGWLDIRETFNQAVRAAGLWHQDPMRRVTRHTLRHTTLSWMAQHGEPLQKIARFAGHSSTHVTEMFYAHLHPEHLKRAAGVIDSVLSGFVTNLVTNRPALRTESDPPVGAQAPDKIDVAVLLSSVPEWRNWQTRETQNRRSAIPVRFEIVRKRLSQKEIRQNPSDAEFGAVAPVLNQFFTKLVTTLTHGATPGNARWNQS